jgi:hypothetical protein
VQVPPEGPVVVHVDVDAPDPGPAVGDHDRFGGFVIEDVAVLIHFVLVVGAIADPHTLGLHLRVVLHHPRLRPVFRVVFLVLLYGQSIVFSRLGLLNAVALGQHRAFTYREHRIAAADQHQERDEADHEDGPLPRLPALLNSPVLD